MREAADIKDSAGEDAGMRVRAFAANELFRSAEVGELDLGGDFLRRPLRPEDLEAMVWPVALSWDTACDLQALAANRLLRCIYDQETVRVPSDGAESDWSRFEAFYGASNRRRASAARPVLEATAFSFLTDSWNGGADVNEVRTAFLCSLRASMAFACQMQALIDSGAFNEDGARMLFAQWGGLGPGKAAAIRRGLANGAFRVAEASCGPSLGHEEDGAALALALSARLGMDASPHSQWQFYLPTALAEANWLDALEGEPARALALAGAAFVERCGRSASEDVLRAWLGKATQADLPAVAWSDRLADEFDAALENIAGACGQRGLAEFAAGVRSAALLARLARHDLSRQFEWLCDIEGHAARARLIERRIRSERPDIDRETFIEPRQMCSTTHVHDDHRLVVIESGRMVFWAAPGMRLEWGPGEMMYVPRGRLHGSSVLTDECIYHQPIIPEEWIRNSSQDKERMLMPDSILESANA